MPAGGFHGPGAAEPGGAGGGPGAAEGGAAGWGAAGAAAGAEPAELRCGAKKVWAPAPAAA